MDFTPAEFQLAYTGLFDHQEKIQRVWAERIRTLAMLLISPHLKKGANPAPETIWPLPWDAERVDEMITNVRFGNDPEVLKRLKSSFDKAFNKN